MFIYQVYGVTAEGRSFTGALLAQDRPAAIALAVQRTKQQFGTGAKVTRLVVVLDAGDIGRVQHSGLHRLLTEFDQLQFVLTHLAQIVQRHIQLVAQLIETVKAHRGESDHA